MPQFAAKKPRGLEDEPTPKRVAVHARSLSQIPKSRQATKDGENTNGGEEKPKDKKKQEDDRYPPTKIKISQDIKKYDHLKKHPINSFLGAYNEILHLVFKFRGSDQKYLNNIPHVLRIAKKLGL